MIIVSLAIPSTQLKGGRIIPMTPKNGTDITTYSDRMDTRVVIFLSSELVISGPELFVKNN